MLEVREITKEYNRRAVVDHVSFTINRSEVLGYLGPNGSGKSTTVRMLTGFIGSDVGRSVVWRTDDPGTLDRV
jgi:ABC-2 type transport system ATP-binding protein